MNKIRVLFLCIHNSARSQMAEAYLKKLGGEIFSPESAGLETGQLNPLAVEVMKEDGIDISDNQAKDVAQFFEEGRRYDYVIIVCDEASASRCPVFPGVHRKINWSFEDPTSFPGSQAEKLVKMREVRDKIKSAILNFLNV